MKKIDLIIAMLLALMLMVLASCKTKQAVQETESISAMHELSVKDSINNTFRFDFDQMDIYVFDTVNGQRSIVKGNLPDGNRQSSTVNRQSSIVSAKVEWWIKKMKYIQKP